MEAVGNVGRVLRGKGWLLRPRIIFLVAWVAMGVILRIWTPRRYAIVYIDFLRTNDAIGVRKSSLQSSLLPRCLTALPRLKYLSLWLFIGPLTQTVLIGTIVTCHAASCITVRIHFCALSNLAQKSFSGNSSTSSRSGARAIATWSLISSALYSSNAVAIESSLFSRAVPDSTCFSRAPWKMQSVSSSLLAFRIVSQALFNVASIARFVGTFLQDRNRCNVANRRLGRWSE